MASTSTKPKHLKQLNWLTYGAPKAALHKQLFRRIRPLTEASDQEIDREIDAQIEGGFKVLENLHLLKEGKLCDECKEPQCCTISDPVVLFPADVAKLEQHGHSNFIRWVNTDDGVMAAIRGHTPCQFLKNNHCTIYEYRPYVCHRYPMHEETKTGAPIFFISRTCCCAFNLLKYQVIEALAAKN